MIDTEIQFMKSTQKSGGCKEVLQNGVLPITWIWLRTVKQPISGSNQRLGYASSDNLSPRASLGAVLDAGLHGGPTLDARLLRHEALAGHTQGAVSGALHLLVEISACVEVILN